MSISKEISRNRFLKASKRKENDLQSCQHRKSCTKKNFFNSCSQIDVIDKLSLKHITADDVDLKPAPKKDSKIL